MLMQHHAIDINSVDFLGTSLLQYAVAMDNHKVVAMLLERQDLVTLNQRDHRGSTPLFDAICCHARDSLILLLANSHLDLDMRENMKRMVTPKEITR